MSRVRKSQRNVLIMRKYTLFFSRVFLFSVVLTSALAACGFRPLQAKNGGVDLASILVTVDHTRGGQLLEAEMNDAFNPDGQRPQKRYQLDIVMTQSEVRLFINPDGTSGRSDIPVASNYTLTRLSDGTVVDRGNVTRVSSYNTSETADYASYVSIQDAKKRAIKELAQSYKLRLSNVLARSTP